MSQRKSPKGTRKKAGAGAKSHPIETRRCFLRVGGAGTVAFMFGSASSARAEGADITLEVDAINPSGTVSVDGQTVSDGYALHDDDIVTVLPNNLSFDIETEGTDDNAVEYDNTEAGDSIEVDLSVLEEFEESYDPNASGSEGNPEDCPYVIQDSEGTIGING